MPLVAQDQSSKIHKSNLRLRPIIRFLVYHDASPVPVFNYASAVLDDKIYVIGGGITDPIYLQNAAGEQNINPPRFPQIVSTDTKTIVSISNLLNGNHTLTIHAEGNYDLDNLFIRGYNSSFDLMYFTVDNSPPTPQPATPSPTPTPTVPESSWVALPTVLIATLFGIIALKRNTKKFSDLLIRTIQMWD